MACPSPAFLQDGAKIRIYRKSESEAPPRWQAYRYRRYAGKPSGTRRALRRPSAPDRQGEAVPTGGNSLWRRPPSRDTGLKRPAYILRRPPSTKIQGNPGRIGKSLCSADSPGSGDSRIPPEGRCKAGFRPRRAGPAGKTAVSGPAGRKVRRERAKAAAEGGTVLPGKGRSKNFLPEKRRPFGKHPSGELGIADPAWSGM